MPETLPDLIDQSYFKPSVMIIGIVLVILCIGASMEKWEDYKEWRNDKHK